MDEILQPLGSNRDELSIEHTVYSPLTVSEAEEIKVARISTRIPQANVV